jgi:hypothetical protein
MTRKEQLTLAWGTTGNEAVHAHLGSMERQVTMQHADLLHTKMNCMALDNLLAHGSAADYPTTQQLRPAYIQAMLHGKLQSSFIAPVGAVHCPTIKPRPAARSPSTTFGEEKTLERK